MGITVVILILFLTGGYTPESVNTIYKEPTYTQPLLIWGYILVIIAILLVIIFPIIMSILIPKKGTKSFVPVIGVIAVVTIAYLLSSDKAMNIVGLGLIENPFILKLSDTLIFSLYILFVVAFVTVIIGEVTAIFKK
jgi:hypothetical protein